MPVIAIPPVAAAVAAGVAAAAVVGPDKLPELGYKVGLFIGELRTPIDDSDQPATGARPVEAGNSTIEDGEQR